MKTSDTVSNHERWAILRFSVVGQLLAAPPPKGELRGEIEKLAAREWQHPITSLPVRFGVSTVERWLHRARKERRDPVRVLRRKVRTDLGAQGSLGVAIRQALRAQYAQHEMCIRDRGEGQSPGRNSQAPHPSGSWRRAPRPDSNTHRPAPD